MTAWLVWRVLKWIGLLALGTGVAGAVWGRGDVRPSAGLHVLPFGLLLTFIAGFGLLELREQTFAEPWVAASLLCGVACAVGASLHASSRESRIGAGMAVGGLLASVGFMVFRDVGLAAGGILGGLGLLLGAATASNDTPPPVDVVKTWFRWIGRAEGISLLTLFGIAMPLKYGAGIPEAVAWTGWLHGVFFLLYVGALVVGVRRLDWTIGQAALGFVASLLPFGTFLFERRVDV